MNNVIGIFIDALRPDFISKTNMPFLYELSNKNTTMELETILGYSDAIDATIFSGVYPNNHGYWMKYWYDPSNSPFNSLILKSLRPIDFIPNSFIKSGINYFLYNSFFKAYANIRGYSELASYNIPYFLLNNFDFTLKKSLIDKDIFKYSTIFDLLRLNNKKFYYSHGYHQNTLKIFDKTDFGIIYLNNIDYSAHLYGIESQTFFKTLQTVDKKIYSIFSYFKKKYPLTKIMIFSDHGMAKVNEIINFKWLYKERDFINKKFLFALDGTMIRFWYFNSDIKNKIHELMEDYDGLFLTDDEKEKLKINFPHNRYGDDIFLFNQGYSIFPNFMSWIKPKAMHAYHPQNKEQRGIFMINDCNLRENYTAKLTDIMPTILHLLNLESPINIEGKSLIR